MEEPARIWYECSNGSEGTGTDLILDEPPSKDKAFRRYASGVERSLSLFDTALQEWADYISFLGRLLKV